MNSDVDVFHHHEQRRWQTWLSKGGEALKWLLMGAFTIAGANLAAPWFAGVIDGLHRAFPHGDAGFFLIGGLVGAAMGKMWGSKGSGAATIALSLCVALCFYFAEGGLTPEQCRRTPQSIHELSDEQARILKMWTTCIYDPRARACSDLYLTGKKLDALYSRKQRLLEMWREDC